MVGLIYMVGLYQVAVACKKLAGKIPVAGQRHCKREWKQCHTASGVGGIVGGECGFRVEGGRGCGRLKII